MSVTVSVYRKFRASIVAASARLVTLLKPQDLPYRFGSFHLYVQREADLFIRSHGPMAHRYACDHVRRAEQRCRKHDVRLYTAVADEIAARKHTTRRVACAAGAIWLPDWLPVVNGMFAILV